MIEFHNLAATAWRDRRKLGVAEVGVARCPRERSPDLGVLGQHRAADRTVERVEACPDRVVADQPRVRRAELERLHHRLVRVVLSDHLQTVRRVILILHPRHPVLGQCSRLIASNIILKTARRDPVGGVVVRQIRDAVERDRRTVGCGSAGRHVRPVPVAIIAVILVPQRSCRPALRLRQPSKSIKLVFAILVCVQIINDPGQMTRLTA